MPIVIVFAAFAVGIVGYGVLAVIGVSDDSAAAIAGFLASAAILGFGLLARGNLPTHERRQILAAKRSLGACTLVGLGAGIAVRLVAGWVIAGGEAVDPGICRELLKLDDDLVPPALWQKLLLAVGLVVLAPLGEELVFRGLLLRGLVRRIEFPTAAILSGIVFALFHTQYFRLWPVGLGIAVFGVVAAYVYRRFGYPANVVMHAVFNGFAAALLFSDFGLDTEITCD